MNDVEHHFETVSPFLGFITPIIPAMASKACADI
jgi:hypothetical protein